MKRILVALTLACLSGTAAQAQSEVRELPLPRIESAQISLSQWSANQAPSRILPDNPIPVQRALQDGPAPCPFGNGKSCALLGGRAYFSDPFHMTEHDATLAKAAKNPAMLTFEAINLLATVADLEGTQACLHAHVCEELNPIFFSHDPSRLRAYSIAMPITFATYVWGDYLKKKGGGNYVIGVLSVATALHAYFAADGFTSATHGPSANQSDARQKFNIAIRF